MTAFAVIAGCHLLLTIIFFAVNFRRCSWLQVVSETMVVLCVPFFGLLIMLMFKLLCRLFHLEKGTCPEQEEEGESFFRGTELDCDIIPLNDAFLVDDVYQKRRFFTETIKQSVVENQSILQMAMHDRDREIAYYAVSMLTARMEKLENELFVREDSILSGEIPENNTMLEEYTELLREYLSQKKFVDPVTWRKKQDVYIGLLDRLLSLHPEDISYYIEEIHQLLDIGNYRTAEQICSILKERFPDREEPFLMFIELYQAERRPKALQQEIQALKACPVDLSRQALRVIRYWDKEAQKNG